MEMRPVKSSNVAEVGYDAATQTLGVRFTSGAVYHYKDVPAEVASGLVAAESPGKFFSAEVRGKFEHTRPEEQ